MASTKDKTTRISVSLPSSLAEKLDTLVQTRGFDSRSQAIGEMINKQLIDESAASNTDILTGTITLCYRHSHPKLKQNLAGIKYSYLAEIITSFEVFLKHEQTLEVILVQGPADKLRAICHEMTSLKGVILGKLQFASAILPQVHENK